MTQMDNNAIFGDATDIKIEFPCKSQMGTRYRQQPLSIIKTTETDRWAILKSQCIDLPGKVSQEKIQLIIYQSMC